jgi:hypothetical protein
MDKDSLWNALGHIVTAVAKNGENKPSGNGDRRGGGESHGAGGFGAAGGLRVKLGTNTATPCCIAKRKGQK